MKNPSNVFLPARTEAAWLGNFSISCWHRVSSAAPSETTRSPRSSTTERAVRSAYLRQVESRPILDVSKYTAAAFGVLAAAVKQGGRSPRPRYNDLWIAAQAIEHGYALLTLNASDFGSLPGLRLVTLSPKTQP